jgi:hypothetical protein
MGRLVHDTFYKGQNYPSAEVGVLSVYLSNRLALTYMVNGKEEV